jgi:hypothetical protein
VTALDDLENLPLSFLFAGPLVAAIDASIQSQSETVETLLETGFDAEGDPVTVTFGYTTTEVDPETGRERRVGKELEVPLLLFLSLPNLQVSRIEEEFSARITETEETERPTKTGRIASPRRLNVTPASQSTSLDRTTKSRFDLNIRMVAELQNESTGAELLERAANNATFERADAERTERLETRRERPSISPERIHRVARDERDDRDETDD